MGRMTPAQDGGRDLATFDFEPPAEIGSLYYKDTDGWTELPPGMFGDFLRTAGPGAPPAWVPGTGLGDMLKSVYDPDGVNADAFNFANFSIPGEVVGDLLVHGVSGWVRIPVASAGSVLLSNGPAVQPSWQAWPGLLKSVYDPTNVFGDAFNFANFSIASQTTGDLLSFNGAAWARLAPSTRGTVLSSNGVGVVPTFQTPPSSSGYITGLKLLWTSVTSVTVLTGAARNTTDTYTMRPVFPLTADITVSGFGGLDTGVETPSTWYAVMLIGDTTGVNTPKAMLTLNPSVPSMPVGYDVWRRIGWVRNNSAGDFLRFGQTGGGKTRRLIYDEALSALAVLGGVSSPTWVATPLSPYVPPTGRWAYLTVSMEQDSALHSARFRATGNTVTEATTPHVWAITDDTAGANRSTRPLWGVPCSGGQSIDYATTGTTNINVSVVGYEDEV